MLWTILLIIISAAIIAGAAYIAIRAMNKGRGIDEKPSR